MIYYDHLPLDKDILKALGELSINFSQSCAAEICSVLTWGNIICAEYNTLPGIR